MKIFENKGLLKIDFVKYCNKKNDTREKKSDSNFECSLSHWRRMLHKRERGTPCHFDVIPPFLTVSFWLCLPVLGNPSVGLHPDAGAPRGHPVSAELLVAHEVFIPTYLIGDYI